MRRITDLVNCKGTLQMPVEPYNYTHGTCRVCGKRVRLSKYGHVGAHRPVIAKAEGRTKP